jgi:hypothetical protein
MNELISGFYEEWRWAFLLVGLAIGQLFNLRRTSALRRQLELTQGHLKFKQGVLDHTQEILEKERQLRQERDAVRGLIGGISEAKEEIGRFPAET